MRRTGNFCVLPATARAGCGGGDRRGAHSSRRPSSHSRGPSTYRGPRHTCRACCGSGWRPRSPSAPSSARPSARSPCRAPASRGRWAPWWPRIRCRHCPPGRAPPPPARSRPPAPQRPRTFCSRGEACRGYARQSPSSAYGVSCRAGAKGACAPTGGGLAPIVGSPASRSLVGREFGFTCYRWRGTLHHRADVCSHNAHKFATEA